MILKDFAINFFLNKLFLKKDEIVRVSPAVTGNMNSVFFITTKTDDYIVRVTCTTEHGKKFVNVINRKNEQYILMKYTRKLMYYDTTSGDYIAKIEPHMHTPNFKSIITSKEYLKAIGAELKKIHSINPTSNFFKSEIAIDIGSHHDQIESKYLVLNSILAKKYESNCICHNDFKIENTIYDDLNGKGEIIDFEWVGLGHYYWDICMFFNDYFKTYDYDQKIIDYFFEGYGEVVDMNIFLEVTYLSLVTLIQREAALKKDLRYYLKLLDNYYNIINPMISQLQNKNEQNTDNDYDDDDEANDALLNFHS